ncbi:MAG: FdhF/YdeP family oxidoreductase [Pseudohongiellaceae bacterium]
MSQDKPAAAGGFKAIQFVMSCARQIGTRKLAAAVRSKNACKACAFGTGGQRGGLHNEYSNRVEICNKNIQAQLSDIRDPIPEQIFSHNTLAELRQLSGKQLEDLGRLAHPLHKLPGDVHYRPITYEQALQRIVERLRETDPQRSFFYGSGRSSNEAAFVLQLFARLFGTNNVNNCSYYCHQASSVGLSGTIGTGTATVQYGDLHKADLILVFGANPASNHPRFVKVLLECRQRGGRVIVVNPAREAGLVRFASPANFRSLIAGDNEVASLYLQPHIGGDIALVSGVAKALLSGEAIDRKFIEQHCSGFDDYCQFIQNLSWNRLEDVSGVSRKEMENVASIYATAERAIFSWGMGLTHHSNGTENIEALCNLALLRGMIGAPGKGLLPLRGHSNVQGVGSMGMTPVLKQQVFDALETKLGLTLPQTAGMDTLACVQAASRGEIDFAFLLGGNLHAANPDAAFSATALDRIPFKVMLSSTLNQTHLFGTEQENIVLPIRVRDEETQATTQESMFNFLRLSDGGFERIPGLLSEVEIIAEIGARVIDPDNLDFRQFRRHRAMRQTIAKVIPGFEALADIDVSKQEFHIGGRHLAEPEFATPDGRAAFRLPSGSGLQPRPGNATGEFMLTTVRSEGQFNTIIYSEEDVYRRQQSRQVLMMNPLDMEELQLTEGDRVDVGNETGALRRLTLSAYDIRAGNVMTYFPEANVLVPQLTDSRSHTPAFKSVAVRITRSVMPATQ